MLVKIFRTWAWPDLMQQTPSHSNVWGGIRFTEDPTENPDFCVVLNNLDEGAQLPCQRNRVFRVVQEPPTESIVPWHHNPPYAAKTFTCDPERFGSEYVRSHPMVPWHVNRDYDFLVSTPVPDKALNLSWITSTKNALIGHKKRMTYLDVIREKLPEVELLGTSIHHITNPEERKANFDEQLQLGFKIVEDKWMGLAPYKYSLAIENFSGPDYWTEKVADCFLAWTLPIYYGCTNLEDYFPRDSFVRIDIGDIEGSIETIQQVLRQDVWERRLPAIMEARELVLNKYQFFPQLSEKIRECILMNGNKPMLPNSKVMFCQEMALRNKNNAQQEIIDSLNARIIALENSISWKITSPIRRLGDKLHIIK